MPEQPDLFQLIGDGDLDAIGAALEGGADPNAARPADGMTPLRLAGRLCDPRLVALLVEHGADVARDGGDGMVEAAVWGHLDTLRAFVAAGVDLSDSSVASPILFEAQRGRHSEAVDYLLSSGAAAVLSGLAYSPLIVEVMQLEVDHEAFSRLLAEGLDPDERAAHGETALMFAAGHGHEKALAMLLDAGADPTLADDWGRTATVWAAEAHKLRLARRLAEEEGRAAGHALPTPLRRTELDDLDTPLSSGSEFVVFYPQHYGKEGVGRVRGLGVANTREGGLEVISDDNNNRMSLGPYLLCARLFDTEGVEPRYTDPLAEPAPSFSVAAGSLLVLAHTPTTPPNLCAPIADQRPAGGEFCGWAVICAVLAADQVDEARQLALEQRGRVTVVRLAAVCSCQEGFVEAHERLVQSATDVTVEGMSELVYPIPESTSGSARRAAQAPPETPESAARRRGASPRISGYHDLDPLRLAARGFELFRKFPVGFMAFALLWLDLAAALFLVPEALIDDSGLSPWLLHGLLWAIGPAPLLAGFFEVVLLIMSGGKPRFGMFLAGYRHLLPMAVLVVVGGLLVWLASTTQAGLWIVLAPYAGFSLMYAVPLIVDRDLGALGAIASSWKLTHATFVGSLFVALGVGLTAISGVALFGIGLVASMPVAGCMLAVAYAETAKLAER